MEDNERRRDFRWKVPFSCQLAIRDEQCTALGVNISEGGACVAVAEEVAREFKISDSEVALVLKNGGSHKVNSRIAHSSLWGGSWSLGIGFSSRFDTPALIAKMVREGTYQSDVLQDNLVAFFNYLADRIPLSVNEAVKPEAIDNPLESFEALLDGVPLNPPAEFLVEMEKVPPGDWQIAVAVVERWTRGFCSFSEDELERLTRGLFWGTLLVRGVEGV